MVNKLQVEIKQSKKFESLEHEAFLNLQRTTDFLMRKVTEALKPFGITPPQYNVLRILRGAGDCGLINREIGERVLTYVPDVTRMLDRLEKRELICRERGVEDRRLVTACITNNGLKLLSDLDQVFKDLNKDLLGVCNRKTLVELIKTLEQLRSA